MGFGNPSWDWRTFEVAKGIDEAAKADGGALFSGDPNLTPFFSNNLDVGAEYYTGGAGVIGATYFHKAISGFTTNAISTVPFRRISAFASIAAGNRPGASMLNSAGTLERSSGACGAVARISNFSGDKSGRLPSAVRESNWDHCRPDALEEIE